MHGFIQYAANITQAAVGCLSANTTLRSGTLLNAIAFNNTDDNSELDIYDSVIYLNVDGANGSHFPYVRGSVNLQSCTIIDQQFLTGWKFTRPILDASQGVLRLTMNDCILDLRSNDGAPVVIANNMNLDSTDTLDANRNIFVSAKAVYGSITKGGTTSDRTLAQIQSLGYDVASITDPNNLQTKLLGATGRILSGSIALTKALVRANAADRTGRVFAMRTTTGAYEDGLPTSAYNVAVGDYNQNGIVDAADYVAWRKTQGTNDIAAYSSADGNGDGRVDGLDYDVWRQHVGQSVPVLGIAADDGSLAAGSAAHANTAPPDPSPAAPLVVPAIQSADDSRLVRNAVAAVHIAPFDERSRDMALEFMFRSLENQSADAAHRRYYFVHRRGGPQDDAAASQVDSVQFELNEFRWPSVGNFL
jgi:hypothetical protein